MLRLRQQRRGHWALRSAEFPSIKEARYQHRSSLPGDIESSGGVPTEAVAGVSPTGTLRF